MKLSYFLALVAAVFLGIVCAVLVLRHADSQGQESPQGLTFEGDTADFTLWVGRWANPCVTYNAIDPQLASMAEQSLNGIWGSVSPVRSCGNVPLGTENITIIAVPTGSLGSNVLGQAGCGSSGGFMVHCSIAIADNGRNLIVMAHELGHTLGMGHSQLGNQLMSAFCCNPLGSDDIAGIRSLYGVVPGPTPIPTVAATQPGLPTGTATSTITPTGCSGFACLTPTVTVRPATPIPTATARPPTPVPPVCQPDGTCLIEGRWVDRWGNIWLDDRSVWWDGRDPAHYYVGGLWLNGDGTIYGGVG